MKNQDSLQKTSPSIRGSVLILILVAIALFGALSFAMTQGMRGGSAQLTDQQAKLAASEVIEYLTKVKTAFDALVINGCDPLAINYSNSIYLRADNTILNTAPAVITSGCELFNTQTGGITPATFEKHADAAYAPTGTQAKSTHFFFRYIDAEYPAGTKLGTAENDLQMRGTGFDANVCLAVLNLVKSSEPIFASIDTTTITQTANPYTQGTAGSMTPFVMPTSSRIFARSGSNTYCEIGIVLKAN